MAQPPEPVVLPEAMEAYPDNDAEAVPVLTQAPAPALPEAPASVNVRVTIAGREVQWTLRDTDEARLAVRLEELLQRYPLPPAPQSGPQVASQGKDWCAIHHCKMFVNTGKDGRTWLSHRLPEGGFCKGKAVRP